MLLSEAEPMTDTSTCAHEQVTPKFTVVETADAHYSMEVSLVCDECGKRAWCLTPRGSRLSAALPVTWDDDAARAHAGRLRGNKKPPPNPDAVIQGIHKKLGEGPGTTLAVMLWEKGIVASCEACDNLARRMNEWGGDCRKHLDEIVDDIVPRAHEWIRKNRPEALRTFVDESRLPNKVKEWLGGNAEIIDKAALAAGALVNVETPIVKAKVRAFVVQALDKWESE